MCLQFNCFACKAPSRWFCTKYNDDVDYCDNITTITATKREKCYTCDLVECLKKELRILVYQEPWRIVGHAEREDWETDDSAKVFEDGDFKCEGWDGENVKSDSNPGDSSAGDRGW